MAKSNTSLPRVSDSPLPSPTLSQASTHVDPRSITDPDDERNPANNVNFPVDGWPTLARIIATKPDLEAFASFTDLGIKSLLYYQAELIYLRKKLHEEEWKDFRTDDIEKSSKYADNLEALILGREASIESKEKDNENSLPLPRQWVLIERIRATLKEYNSALLEYSQVAELRDTENCNVNLLMSNCVAKVGRGSTALTGIGAFAWGDYNQLDEEKKPLRDLFRGLFTSSSQDDKPRGEANEFQEKLIVPRQGKPSDGLTQWVKRCFIPFYDQLHEDNPFRNQKRYLLPFWDIGILFGLTFFSLFRLLLWLCRKAVFSGKPSNKTDAATLEKGAASDASSSGTLGHTSSNDSEASNETDISASSVKSITGSFKEYSGFWILRVTSIITTVVACLLPTIAITILAKVHGMGVILGLIALFTAIFAFGLVLLSSTSSRVEIFTATAAFSAVMVVFVQNQIGPQ